MIINFNIPLNTAVALLNERMRWEFKFRKKANYFDDKSDLSELSYEELLPIVEAAAFDLVAFLPYDILIQQNDLIEIFTNAIRSLSKIYGIEEFNKYSKKRCEKLFERLVELYSKANTDKTFQYN